MKKENQVSVKAVVKKERKKYNLENEKKRKKVKNG